MQQGAPIETASRGPVLTHGDDALVREVGDHVFNPGKRAVSAATSPVLPVTEQVPGRLVVVERKALAWPFDAIRYERHDFPVGRAAPPVSGRDSR